MITNLIAKLLPPFIMVTISWAQTPNPAPAAPAQKAGPGAEAQIRAVIDRQMVDWNRGDTDGFLRETDDDPNGDATVGVVFGPQYGPVTAKMIEEVIRPAARRYEDLVFAGFSFDGPAQAVIDEGHPRLRMHLAHIRPDVNPGMNGLLKEQPGRQLFTVFGRPRTTLDGPDGEGMYRMKMEGVDIYDPVTNAIVDTGATKVAAWFVDGDYDGRTFCITQAFFPDRTACEKLSKALAGVVDPDRFEAFSGTVSLPFPAGQHRCVAVKVIDPRGNEVMRVHPLGPEGK